MPRDRGISARSGVTLSSPLQVMTPEQVLQVDRALASIGHFGEVRLIKIKGQLRFIQQLESQDILQGERGAGFS